MANKLVQQQLKNIIRSLTEKELEKVVSNFENVSGSKLERTCRMVSYKCFEATITSKSRKANGYGRNEIEASMNCIKNFLEFVIEEETGVHLVMKSLKKDQGENAVPEPVLKVKVEEKVQERSSSVNTKGPSRDHQEKANTTLNVSYSHALDHHTSFDMKGDLDGLSKNIGNLSMINNSKIQETNINVSQLEMDDLLLKMMLDGDKKGNTPQYSNPFLVQKDPKATLKENEKPPVRNSHPTEFQVDRKAPVRGSFGTITHVGEELHTEPSYDKRFETLNSNNISKMKASNSQKVALATQVPQGSVNFHNQTAQVHYAQEVHKLAHTTTGGFSTCNCNCYDLLQKANFKIESLEKKVKLLLEENRILKYLASETKEPKPEAPSHNTSTQIHATKSMFEKSVSNAELSHLQPAVSVIQQASQVLESLEEGNDLNDKQNTVNRNAVYRFMNNKEGQEKTRSASVDTYAKRNNYVHHLATENSTPTNKENQQVSKPEKRDIKKMIPRLRLEMLPNYHGNSKPPTVVNTSTPPNENMMNKTYTTSSQNALKAQMQKAFPNPNVNPLSEYNHNNSFSKVQG